MTLSPVTRRRLAAFRANRRGSWSLVLFLSLFALSLFAEFIANDRPLLIRYDGKWFSPVLADYAEEEFSPDLLPTSADYSDPMLVGLIAEKGWMLWPPIPYSHRSVVKNLPVPAPARPSTNNLLVVGAQEEIGRAHV